MILYAVISTATGLEEDENQNYIPDWIERRFPKIFKGSKDLDKYFVYTQIIQETIT